MQGVCKNRLDREAVPCPDCGDSFPTRRQLQEHRRNRHKKQNIGHSVGQYFHDKTAGRYMPSSTVNMPALPSNLPSAPLPAFGAPTAVPDYHERLACSDNGHHHHQHYPCDMNHHQPSAQLIHGPADLPLPQLSEPVQQQENFGSILRQVYDSEHASADFSRASPPTQDFGGKYEAAAVGAGSDQYISQITMLYDLL